MSDIMTIPQKLMQKGELVIMPRADYEAMFETQKRLLREENNTDEAIRIFEKERAAGTLQKTATFSEILKPTTKKTRRK